MHSENRCELVPYRPTCMDLSDRSIILNGVGQRLVRSASVSLRSDAPEDADGAAPGAEATLLSSMHQKYHCIMRLYFTIEIVSYVQ